MWRDCLPWFMTSFFLFFRKTSQGQSTKIRTPCGAPKSNKITIMTCKFISSKNDRWQKASWSGSKSNLFALIFDSQVRAAISCCGSPFYLWGPWSAAAQNSPFLLKVSNCKTDWVCLSVLEWQNLIKDLKLAYTVARSDLEWINIRSSKNVSA